MPCAGKGDRPLRRSRPGGRPPQRPARVLPPHEALTCLKRDNSGVIDAVLNMLSGAVTSPWVYPVLFTMALLDGVLPVLPAESLLITAGMYAASGRPNILLVVAMGAAGAFAGDHT